jgi:Zn-dependent protease with chaperone function
VRLALAALAALALLGFGAPGAVLAQGKGKTELEKELKDAQKRDHAAIRARALEPYTVAGADPLSAFITDKQIAIVNQPEATAFLNEMAQLMLMGWNAPKPDVRIILSANPEWQAFAWAPGLIEITTGMIAELPNVNALAAVVAHELAHVLLAHADQRERTSRILATAVSLGSSAPVYAGMAQQKGVTKGAAKTGQLNVSVTPQMQATMITGFAADAVLSDSFLPIAQAKQEYEADRIAVDLLAKSPFSADGQADLFSKLATAEAQAGQRMQKATDATATLVAARVLGAMPAAKDDTQSSVNALAALGAAAGVQTVLGAIGKRTTGQADPAERRKRYNDYAKAYGGEYPLADESAPAYVGAAQRFAALRKSPGFVAAAASARASREVQASFQAREANARAALAGASVVVATPAPLPASASFATNPQVPLSFLVKAQLQEVEGRPAEARKTLQAGAALPGFPLNGWQRLGEHQLAARDYAGLQRTIEQGSRAAGSQAPFLALMTAQAAAQQKAADAEVLAARCLKEGGAQLYTRCEQRLGYKVACGPRTDPGKAAFAEARTSREFADLFQLQRTAMGEGAAISCA